MLIIEVRQSALATPLTVIQPTMMGTTLVALVAREVPYDKEEILSLESKFLTPFVYFSTLTDEEIAEYEEHERELLTMAKNAKNAKI